MDNCLFENFKYAMRQKEPLNSRFVQVALHLQIRVSVLSNGLDIRLSSHAPELLFRLTSIKISCELKYFVPFHVLHY